MSGEGGMGKNNNFVNVSFNFTSSTTLVHVLNTHRSNTAEKSTQYLIFYFYNGLSVANEKKLDYENVYHLFKIPDC